MSNKALLLAVMCVVILNLAGCYDNDEIDSLANVVALGIEKSGDSTGFTFAIADTGSFENTGDDGSKSGILCCFAQTDSIENAIDEVNRRLSKKLSFSHMSIIIAAKSSAREGIFDTVNYFEGMPDVRPQTLIAVSEIKPSEYLKNLNPSLEVNLEKYFLNVFQKGSGYIPVLRISDYTNSVSCATDVISPVISGNPAQENSAEESSYVLGAALMRGGKLRFDVQDAAITGLLNSTKNVAVEYNGTRYILHSVKKPKITAKRNGTKTHVTVQLSVESKGRQFKATDFLEEKVRAYLAEASASGYDIFGFSDLMKKSFKFQKSYDGYDWKSQLMRCDYSVNIEMTS